MGAFLRTYATKIAVLAAIVALLLFIPAALTASTGLRVFLIILIILLLGGGVSLLFLGNFRGGNEVHFFLYDRRRSRMRRRDELSAEIVQDAMDYYLQALVSDQLALWQAFPKPLRLQLEAQPQFRAPVMYRMLYLLSECEQREIFEIFSKADERIVTHLCHVLGDAEDTQMADFIYHLKQNCHGERERTVAFFQKNKHCFAARALRFVERHFDSFYVSKDKLFK